MDARYLIAAVIVSLGVSTSASASVLSASSQAAQPRPAERMDYLDVTAVQNDLNASFQHLADESAASGSLSSPPPRIGTTGGYFVGVGGGGGIASEPARPGADVSYPAGGGVSAGDVFADHNGQGISWLPITAGGGREGALGPNRGGNRGGGNRGGGNRGGGHRGGAHAAPEPSTWMLLGAGLAMLGGYSLVRRRQTTID